MFSSLNLHKQLLKAIDKLGFSEPTDVQQKTIPVVMQGSDLMVCAETGSGKTAAFLLPALNRLLASGAPNTGTRVLILLPTRELALQIQKACDALATFTHLKTGLIIGGEAFKHQVATLRKNPEILIATPGRLVEHIERGTTDLTDLEVLILDEADRMLDLGFSEEMFTIAAACNDERQNLLFSATLKHKALGSISKKILKNPEVISINSGREIHGDIKQQLILADDVKHKEKLVAAVIEEEQAQRVFIFCNTRSQCSHLGNYLVYKKMKAGFLHGEISQSDRKQILNRFRNGHLQVLVATDVAARGLDIDDIDLVINFDVAHCADDHIHRCGRTGRAGKKGLAVTLVSTTEWNLMSSIERYLHMRFEHRKIKGLIAHYKGPKKVKASGKAAGNKKKKVDKKINSAKPARKAAVKKGAGRKTPSIKTKSTRDGFSPLRKK